MINGRRVLAIVPARGGSKGLPSKNTRMCAGKPLIHWTLEAAKKSKYIDRTIVSTDSTEIIDVARSIGADVPFTRPAELARDDSTMSDVVLHAVDWAKPHGFDVLLLLQTTSPLRNSNHIDAALEQFENTAEPDATLVSVMPAPPKSAWLLRSSGEYIDFAISHEKAPKSRQELPQLYYPNGAIYVARVSGFTGAFFTDHTRAFVMSPDDSIDIDTAEEFAHAERLLGLRASKA